MWKRVFALLMIVCLLFTACGSEQQTEGESTSPVSEQESADGEKEWKITELKLPDADGALDIPMNPGEGYETLMMEMVGETIYRYITKYNGTGEITHYYVQTLEAPYEAWQTHVISLEDQTVHRQEKVLRTYTKDGEMCLLYEDEGEYYRERISVESGFSREKIPAEGMEELLQIAKRWYIHDGKDYIFTSEGMMCFQDNFAVSKMVAQQNMRSVSHMAETPSGEKCYLCGGTEDYSCVAIWSPDQSEPVAYGSADDSSHITFWSETDGYLCDQEGVWQFSTENAVVEQVQSFNASGYYPKGIWGATAREDGSLLMLVETDSGYSLYERVEKPVNPDKKTLELAVNLYANDPFLEETIVRFNQQSEEYRIVLRECPQDIYWEDYLTRIRTEISGGGGPDLFLTSVLSKEDAVPQGYMRDLTADFADLQEKGIENAWQNGVVDGKLYTIPYTFTVETFAVKKSVVGDRTSWTLEELMQATEESGLDAFTYLAYWEGSYIFYYLGIVNENNSKLIDWENMTCNLNGPEAMALLEFAAEYTFTDDDGIVTEEDVQRVLAEYSSFYDLWRLQYYETRLYAGVEEDVYIGYPTENGEGQHVMQCSDIAVNQACKYPEGAIEFLRFLVSEETQNRIVEHQMDLKCGFPVRKDSLDLMYEKAVDGYYDDTSISAYYIDDVPVSPQPVSEATVQQLWEVLETAKPRSGRTSAIFDMVYEETESYFVGDKSAQEVLDILQNRVQLYLDEIN